VTGTVLMICNHILEIMPVIFLQYEDINYISAWYDSPQCFQNGCQRHSVDMKKLWPHVTIL
jgi:hypothetical protein